MAKVARKKTNIKSEKKKVRFEGVTKVGPHNNEAKHAKSAKNKRAIKKDKKKGSKFNKDESMSGSEMSFDEESIKKRITEMLEQYKAGGGVLEMQDDGEGSEIASDDGSEDNMPKKKKVSKVKISPGKNNVQKDSDSENGEDEAAEVHDDSCSDDEGEHENLDDNHQNEELNSEEETGDKDLKAAKEKEKREKKKFDFERNNRTIFVGNLPTTFDQKAIAKLFKTCGKVESARIRSVVPEKEKLSQKVALIAKKIHPKTDSFNAYVVFVSNDSVDKALKLNGKVIDGHHIRVDRAQMPKAKRETLTSRKKSVFVGNLRFDLRDDDLINHFKKVGDINYVRIVRDSSTGLGKGFGFVVFNERATVKKALELNETQFKGRTLRVKKVEK